MRFLNIFIKKLILTLIASVMLSTTSQRNKNYVAALITGYKGYTEIEIGNINILLSVPHDGYLNPSNIPNRTEINIVTDYNTKKLADIISDELNSLFGKNKGIANARPFMVTNNLHRRKVDPNRNNIECCVNQDDDAMIAYNDYHNMIKKYFINDFMLNGNKKYEQGLLIDIHGQSHAEKWVELGYTISISDLNKPQKLTKATASSISYLASKSNYDYDDLVRGRYVSLGGIMQTKYSLKVVPSPDHPGPGNGSYYNGGFITQTYGSKNNFDYKLNAIQIESPYVLRTNDVIKRYGKMVANSIFDYYVIHSMENFKK